MPEQQPARTVEQAYLMPNEDQRGFSTGLDMKVGFDEASSYINEALRDLMQYGRMSLENIAEGGKYRFGSGTESAPAISFSADTDNGFYYIGANNVGLSVGGTKRWDFQTTQTVTTLNLLPSASDLDLGSSTARWDLFGQDVNVDTSLTLSFLTAGRVPIVSTGGLILDDSGFTFDATADALTVSGYLRVGTATDAAAAGDVSSGLTGADRFFYDQSTNIFEQFETSTDDPVYRFTLAAANSYAIGIDNSDSDKWKVSYGSAGNAVLGTNDYLTIGTDGEVIAPQWMQIGTSTDSATQGDIVAGLTGAARLFYDQSAARMLLYDSAGASIVSFDASGSTPEFSITSSTARSFFERYSANTSPPIWTFRKSRSSAGAAAAANDNIAQVDFEFRNSTPATTLGSRWLYLLRDATAGSEDVLARLFCTVAGASREYIRFGDIDGGPTLGVEVDSALDGIRFVARYLCRVGTATDAAATGDLSSGLTGAARLFYDQSIPAFYLYNSSSAISVQLSQVAGTDNIFNEAGVDINERHEGDNKTSLLNLDSGDDEVSVDGRFSLRALTAAQITANQNDYNPESTATDRSSFWRLSSDASRNITGIANGLNGRMLYLVNVGATDIVIQHQNAGSAAGNRIITQASADVTMGPDETMILIYDSTTARWRSFEDA